MILFNVKRKAVVLKAKKRPAGRLSNFSKEMAMTVKADLVKGFSAFKKRISKDDLAQAWKTTDWAKVMKVIPWEHLPNDLSGFSEGMRSTVLGSAARSISHLPPPVKEGLRFDTKNRRIENFLNTRVGNMVVGIQADTQKTIQKAVMRSFDRALTPDKVAAQIKGSIGLYPAQEQALSNYRSGLELAEMKPRMVDDLTSKYEDRLLEYRARMIARTETRQAANYGQLYVWQEASNQALIPNTARKVWITDGDPCEICDPMDGVDVGLAEAWTLPGGDVVDIPSEAHPHCMCGMELDMGESNDQGTFAGESEEA